jgi:galactan 5-O-arabinofuranosyltransferase
MDFILSIATLQILAASKLILFASFVVFLFLLARYNRPWAYVVLITISVSATYYVLSAPLQTFFWGGRGDETFVAAYLSRVLNGEFLSDFYYFGLPPFYPPLYFWITGFVSKPFVASAIGAGKIGVLITLLAWWVVPYFLQRLFYCKWFLRQETEKTVISSQWFWFLVPTFLFVLLDFDSIILKPYETLPALLCVLFIGVFASMLGWSKWEARHYLTIGFFGGALFLSYYFWWFILIPVMFALAVLSKDKWTNILRVVGVGAVMFVVASPYLIPLLGSFAGGIENWQAIFFIPSDFWSFAPWGVSSLRGLVCLLGLFGLIRYRKNPFIRANLLVLGMAYAYQGVSMILFLLGGKPIQAAKPFLFLGTATLCVGAAAAIISIFKFLSRRLDTQSVKSVALVMVIVFVSLMPQIRFLDDPKVLQQIESDLLETGDVYLAENIQNTVPDWNERAWLSSGTAGLNAYLPIHYFLAHNPHFSHQAAKFSERFDRVVKLANAGSSERFVAIADEQPRIDALLFFKDPGAQTYPLFFWEDNYPNGGKEIRIEIDPDWVSEKFWDMRHEDDDWVVYTRKE